MELPKHTTQVGTIAAGKKLYLEDYCISYMKQLGETYPEERKQIALYGTVARDKGIEYALVYGASLLGRGRGRTDSLTTEQKEEAEIFRKEFFSEYQLVGVVISTDHVDENVYWMGNGNKSIPMDGYYIFYDTNEAMLNFMMKNQSEDRDIDLDPVIVKKADMDREKRERAEREQQEALQKRAVYRKKLQSEARTPQPEQTRRRNPFPAAACILLLAIFGIYGVKNYYPDFSYQQVANYVSGLWKGDFMLAEDPQDESQTLLAAGTDLIVENSKESDAVASEGMSVVSTEVDKPADLDVIVIPNLDEVTGGGSIAEENGLPAEGSGAEGSQKPEGDTTAEGGQNSAQTTTPESGEKPVTDSSAEDGKNPGAVVTETDPPADAQPQTYLIKKGDNLLRILRTHYGDESKLSEICDVNGIADPNNIQVGQKIVLP